MYTHYTLRKISRLSHSLTSVLGSIVQKNQDVNRSSMNEITCTVQNVCLTIPFCGWMYCRHVKCSTLGHCLVFIPALSISLKKNILHFYSYSQDIKFNEGTKFTSPISYHNTVYTAQPSHSSQAFKTGSSGNLLNTSYLIFMEG